MSHIQSKPVGSPSGVTGNILSSDTFGAEQTADAPPFGNALVRAGEQNQRIVGLTADLGKYTDIHLLPNASPSASSKSGWQSKT